VKSFTDLSLIRLTYPSLSRIVFFTMIPTTDRIPVPTLERLCRVYNLLAETGDSISLISSAELGEKLGLSAASIRKDLSIIGDPGNAGAKYDARSLRQHLEKRLGLGVKRTVCVVGIGKLGSAILDFGLFTTFGFEIVAGFDSSVNIIETKKTKVTLYPSYQIPDVVRREGIELAFLCVPAKNAQSATDKLIEGGIKGIINFTPAAIITNKHCFIAQIDVMMEIRMLSALIALSARNE
jgi:redox-sensing transcriptional repressor